MSDYYYLVCEQHKEAVYITDNKGNPPEREEVKLFLLRHVYPGCKIAFQSEHEIDTDLKMMFEIRELNDDPK